MLVGNIFMRREAGFTLLELMVVIVIISIMAVFAYPSFVTLQYETRRSDAQSGVIATESLVERYLAENNLANLSSANVTSDFPNYSPSSGTAVLTDNSYYRLTIVPDSSGYTINATATVSGGLSDCTGSNAEYKQCADTLCRVISISDGAKQSTNSSGVTADESTTECW